MQQNKMLPEAIGEKRILFCILDWGLGHATRSSVLIDRLLKQDNKITIVCSQSSLGFLKQKYPALPIICIEGYNIKYYQALPALLSVVMQIKKVRLRIKIERQFLQKEILKNEYDIIISDSRYGCYHNEIPSVFISHQLQLKMPFLAAFINKQYQKYLLPFHSIWVPDFEDDNNLSGDLSHSISKLDTNTKNKLMYIGPLSRFNFEARPEKGIDLLFILSGPEPMRTMFEVEVIKYSKTAQKKIVLIRGTEENGPLPIENELENLEVHNLLGEGKLKEIIENTKTIVSRSGYSSIMDYYQLPIVKYIIATPGQTEQEYLADYLNNRFGFKKIRDLKEID
jgi:uncharacterized protein (TIGR00661 family)